MNKKGEAETRKSLAEGHGITFSNAEEAIKWLKSGDKMNEIERLDKLFSKYIHLRDKVCQGCGRSYGKLDTAHCYGRRYRSIRFDPDNSCLLCFLCHQYYDHHETEKFLFFKKRLGEKFDLLIVRSNTRQKIDVKLIELDLKQKLKDRR